MKNLSLFVSAVALLSASSAFAAINCATLPTCESLGYNDTVTQCPNKSIKCPFDTSKGTCLHEAAIGEIAYFPGRAPLGKGWLPCDGSTYSRAEYPELADFLDRAPLNDTSSKYGNPFCESSVQKYHGSCSTSTFAVPDYRGYFLRVAGMWRDGNSTSWNANFVGGKQAGRVSSINTPENEGLPNIRGQFSGVGQSYASGEELKNSVAGSFYIWNQSNAPEGGAKVANDGGQRDDVFGFNAGLSNPIYGRPIVEKETVTISKRQVTKITSITDTVSHVIPANYSVYAYIYAGRVVKK